MKSLSPFYQCPLFSENLKDGILGYTTMIIAMSYGAWLSAVITEDYVSPTQPHSITGFLKHDACAHLRVIMMYNPNLIKWIGEGKLLRFLQRVFKETESTDDFKSYCLFIFYFIHEFNTFDYIMTTPKEIYLREHDPLDTWREKGPINASFVRFLATYGRFFITGDPVDTKLNIDEASFYDWLLSIDPLKPMETKFFLVGIKDVESKFGTANGGLQAN